MAEPPVGIARRTVDGNVAPMLERTTHAAGPVADNGHRLRDVLRHTRIESARRIGVVVDLHDVELVRLELLNEALDPVFAALPPDVDLFDRGVSRGENPRLWLDAIAHVAMGRDKRMYCFVQDTRYGRKILAQSANVAEMAEAIATYLARRLIERERALADSGTTIGDPRREPMLEHSQRGLRTIGVFLFGVFAGLAALVIAALLSAPR